MSKLWLAISWMAMSGAVAYAIDSPWAGTWKLDTAKSTLTGDSFTFAKQDNGKWHCSAGKIEFDFSPDGKDYPMPWGTVQSFTATSDSVWDSVEKLDGKERGRSHYELSPDGKTLTETDSGTKPDGSSFTQKTVYTRGSGGTGFAGKWRSTKTSSSDPNTIVISVPSDGTIRWEVAEFKVFAEGKTDGSDLQVTGPDVPKGLTWAIKSVSPTQMALTYKAGGKILGIFDLTLSSDGRNMVFKNADPASDPTVRVYAKQ